MWRDLRYAAQGLRRSPAFTAAVTLSLGLAIGANATIFGAIDALWLRPPGARDPGGLVRVFSTSGTSREGLWSFAEYRDLRDGATSFTGVAARGRRGTLLRLPDGTTELQLVNVVSLDFFTTLGVNAAIGRTFAPGDAAALERTPAIVLGHDLWKRRYGADAGIVGRTLVVGGGRLAVTVLGVLGLLLTAVGVYGVVSFKTAARTREIGVRVALGADRRDVLGLVLRQGGWLAGVGVAAGVPAAMVVARGLSSLLFGIGPLDLASFAAAAIAAAIVMVATLLPARRALAVMPSVALRNE